RPKNRRNRRRRRTAPTAGRRSSPMRNILALAEKELRSYFASPIAYVIIGLFALLFGFFYDAYLTMFLRQSEQMMGMGGAPNVNQVMIRGVLLNTAVIILFVMP